MADDPKIGATFRSNYALPERSVHSSKRFRSRLYANYRRFIQWDRDYIFAEALRLETGEVVPSHHGIAAMVYGIEEWFAVAEEVDLLSAITLIFRQVVHDYQRPDWLAAVRQVFAQESVPYIVDNRCGVHRNVDEEFERVVRYAISGLDATKYAAAREAFQSAYNNVTTTAPDYKAAVRDLLNAPKRSFA